MLKWAVGAVAVLALVVGGVVLAGPQLLLHFPVLIRIVSQVSDPIGPNQPVTWETAPPATDTPAERPPNVVFIVVDDLGWNDLTWNGGGVAGGSVPTPNIDSLAREGAEFTMGYAGNATCAPSRAALMTGRYPPRFGFESTPAPPAMGAMGVEMQEAARQEGQAPGLFHAERVSEVPSMYDQGMPASEITIAELLRDHGYHTLLLGKWHLGSTAGQIPTDQGFDEFLGFEAGGALFGREDERSRSKTLGSR